MEWFLAVLICVSLDSNKTTIGRIFSRDIHYEGWLIRSLMKLRDFLDLISYITLGDAVAQSVERATPGEEVPGSIRDLAARSVLVGSVSV